MKVITAIYYEKDFEDEGTARPSPLLLSRCTGGLFKRFETIW